MLQLLVFPTTLRPQARFSRSTPPHCSLLGDIWTGAVAKDARTSLLGEAQLEWRADLVELPVMFANDEGEASFDFERWRLHRSSSRYGSLLIGVLLGVTTRRISVTVALLVAFSAVVQGYASVAAVDPSLPELALPLTPFELTAPVLGLLLVFRTNTANDRFNVGSDASWEVTGRLRSCIRQLIVWTAAPSVPAEEREAAAEIIDAYSVLHDWVMTSYLRGEPSTGQQAAVLRAALGGGEAGLLDDGEEHAEHVADGVADGSSTPWLALTALSYSTMHRLPSIEVNERIALEGQITELTCALGMCEKILRTPIPLGYTRYSVRFLWIWLSLLPFALAQRFAEFGVGTWWEDKPQPVLPLAMLFIGFTFLSIEDIAVQIEEPFAILPLEQHQRWLLRDVEQMKRVLRQHQRLVDGAATVRASALK